ncbi:hypothetical protein ACFSHQ_10310 [Gemmobacter lanyuensis]
MTNIRTAGLAAFVAAALPAAAHAEFVGAARPSPIPPLSMTRRWRNRPLKVQWNSALAALACKPIWACRA